MTGQTAAAVEKAPRVATDEVAATFLPVITKTMYARGTKTTTAEAAGIKEGAGRMTGGKTTMAEAGEEICVEGDKTMMTADETVTGTPIAPRTVTGDAAQMMIGEAATKNGGTE